MDDRDAPTATSRRKSVWIDENTASYLRLRIKTFYNADYFDRIVLPLLDIPAAAQLLDVGCGYGGLSLLLAERRPDLHITAVDFEPAALESAAAAMREGLANVTFVQGDAQRLQFDADTFDTVVCQTLLTHVADAEKAVREMARVLKPGGVFMAAEYATLGAWGSYDNVGESRRDEAWHREYFRVLQSFVRGKQTLGRGDDRIGVRVPLLATSAGLDVFDVRLNDRALCVIPPYRHDKQSNYLEVLKAFHAKESDGEGLAKTTEIVRTGGGTDEDAAWLYNAVDHAAIRQAIDDRTLATIGAYQLFLTFARKL